MAEGSNTIESQTHGADDKLMDEDEEDDKVAADVGHFACQLSSNVTHDAVLLASQNGQVTENVSGNTIVTSCDPNGAPENPEVTPGGRYISVDNKNCSSASLDDCPRPKRQSPAGKIRDVSRTLSKWLKIKKSNESGATSSSTNHSSWKLWRLTRKGSGSCHDPSKRALPPVPAAAATSAAESELDDHVVVEPYAQQYAQPSRLTYHETPQPGEAYLPDDEEDDDEEEMRRRHHSASPEPSGNIDFAASIEKVKNYGWYWGPLSGEAAEQLLRPEPDGSFVVRDSSDDHYIFSLTFKLDGKVRHVRIEHDHGNFSFGSLTKFKSHTIVEFIENAVEHSRSGRYLFFIQRRPVNNGPMRVQLLHPVSRFKQIQSLQHLCRFVILKLVPRDLLHELPVPKKIREYLNTKNYYSEAVAELTASASLTENGANFNQEPVTSSSRLEDLERNEFFTSPHPS